jgi:2'-5' RNA ligase
MRTFVAIELAHGVKENISQFIKKLDFYNPNIRWVKTQAMHLTLKFIGEITPNKVNDIQSVLMELSTKYERFTLRLFGTGTFPPRSRNPRVIWLGIEECDALMSLQKDIEFSLEKLSIPREKRKFAPHLTLGRVKSSLNIKPVLDDLSRNKDTEFGCMEVDKMTFFQSTLKPTGAEYTVLANIELK